MNHRLFYRFGISDGFECIETAETPVEAMQHALRIANWLKFPVWLNEFVPPRRLVNSRQIFPWGPGIVRAAEEQRQAHGTVSRSAFLYGGHEKTVIEARSGMAELAEAVAAALVISIKEVQEMVEKGEVIAYPALSGEGLRFPRWQFHFDGRFRVKSWVELLTTAFEGSGWPLLDFIAAPQDSLKGLNYLTVIENENGLIETLAAAKRFKSR